ncbi:hypothetical protein HDV00_007821 [Rhizophlyctis rosea]|nr:hypothetical protein HDV00_007821 [Rhizophlyctis rosea]
MPPNAAPHEGTTYTLGTAYNTDIDLLRPSEYPHLTGQTYLDHAGTTIHAKSVVEGHYADLMANLLGNPHSAGSPASMLTTERVDAVRRRVLSVDSTEFSVIFTANATAAVKLIGESVDWTRNNGQFWYLRESHTSVVGLRNLIPPQSDGSKLASGDGGVRCVTTDAVEEYLAAEIEAVTRNGMGEGTLNHQLDRFNLFAFPAQCNHSGRRYPLHYINLFHMKQHSAQSALPWKVLLDAASYATTTPPDLRSHPADFLVLSFYKLFGFPTGLGALVVRRSAAASMQKRYFGGGTVSAVVYDQPWQKYREDISAKFEDGTLPFQQILALDRGFDYIEQTLGGWARLRSHTMCLTSYVYEQMKEMQHETDSSTAHRLPLCQLYSSDPSIRYPAPNNIVYSQGPIINFNLLRPDGTYIRPSEVMRLASINNIHLRSGCFCNPGACQTALGLSSEEVRENAEIHGHVCWDDKDIINNKPTGSLRISFGASSTFTDAMTWLQFLRTYFIQPYIQPPPLTTTTPLPTPTPGEIKITSLTIYPIKSCGGYEVTSWPIGPTGLLLDRRWVVVDEDGKAMTQKRSAKMAAICVVGVDVKEGWVDIRAPGMERVRLWIDDEGDGDVQGGLARVCGDCVKTTSSTNTTISTYLSTYLGLPCRLVRAANETHPRTSRLHRSTYCVDPPPLSNAAVGFANESQYLVISRPSIRHLSGLIPGQMGELDVTRFRANIVVDGDLEPYEEDGWKGRRLGIGEGEFQVLGPCHRCRMVCIDQKTGEQYTEPYSTLAKCRMVKGVGVVFGMHLAFVPGSGGGLGGLLRVGDVLKVG